MGLFRYTRKTFARELFLLMLAILFCVPLYTLLVLSLKTNAQVNLTPLTLPTNPNWHNYSRMWEATSASNVTIGRSLVNSIILTVGSVAVLVSVGSLCAYTLARRRSRLSTGLYLLFVAGLIIPFTLGIIPLYVFMRQHGLTGSYLGMIVLQSGLYMPLSVFLYAGFIRTLPREYEEAAQVDGAGLVRTLVSVVLPLLRPITGTVAVLTGVFCWNDFLLSLIFLSGSKNQALPVAVFQFVANEVAQWDLIFPTIVVALLPMMLFYFFAQKQLIKGFAGGIRG